MNISVNTWRAKRSLTEYGVYPYAAGDLFALFLKNKKKKNKNFAPGRTRTGSSDARSAGCRVERTK